MFADAFFGEKLNTKYLKDRRIDKFIHSIQDRTSFQNKSLTDNYVHRVVECCMSSRDPGETLSGESIFGRDDSSSLERSFVSEFSEYRSRTVWWLTSIRL